MAIALAQTVVMYDNGFGGATTATATFGSNLTSGSRLFTFTSCTADKTAWFTVGNTTHVTDSAGNTWTVDAVHYWANVGYTIMIASADNTHGTTSGLVVTVDYSTSVVNRSGGIAEFTGLATGAKDTNTAGNNSFADPATDVSMTTTANGDLILCAGGGDVVPSAAGSGFTLLGTVNSSSQTAWEYQVQTSSGSITPTMDLPSVAQFVICSAAYKVPAGAAAYLLNENTKGLIMEDGTFLLKE